MLLAKSEHAFHRPNTDLAHSSSGHSRISYAVVGSGSSAKESILPCAVPDGHLARKQRAIAISQLQNEREVSSNGSRLQQFERKNEERVRRSQHYMSGVVIEGEHCP